MSRLLYLSVEAALLAIAIKLDVVLSAVLCNNTATCARLLRPGSDCVDGQCQNPFVHGCLRRVLGTDRFPAVRACNSDDPPGAAQAGTCANSVFDYPEIRVASGNWESSMFMSWIIQIFLSELLAVPVSMEMGKDGTFSFYDSQNDFTYPKDTYNWDALAEASSVVDCRNTEKSCAHVIPEVWNGQTRKWFEAQEEGIIEPVFSTDVIGKFGWYVPKFTVQRDPSLVSLAGLKGEANRKKLAERFKRPTTWLKYCRDVSPNNCDADDGVAMRWPSDASEEASYFVENSYKGHFRATEKNNCTLTALSFNCSGHFVEGTCEWSTYTQSQLYWNDVKMESDGPLAPAGAYSWASMIQIWYAANATQSDVMMVWWQPDSMMESFREGAGEFVHVSLYEPTEQCTLDRVNSKDRCSADPSERHGDPQGSCDYEAHVLKKAITASLETSTNAVSEASRSAGYDTIKRLPISDLAIDQMLSKWVHRGVDKYGYDPREVVCSWFAENVEDLKKFIPSGYPRQVLEESPYNASYLYAAMAVGALTTILIILAASATYRWRKRRVMVYAQPSFLLVTLLGFLLVSGGAIAYTTEPSLPSCVVRQWLIMLGYSLELLPVIVKVAAINKLLQSGMRMKRAALSQRKLFGFVGFFTAIVATYLTVWTALDPPTRQEKFVLTQEVTEEGGAFIEVAVECSSSSNGWAIAALSWQGVLLLCATVLGFQTRNVRQEFNESQRLAVMIYSHFVFIAMRLVLFLLSPVLRANARATSTSFFLSFDTLFALGIYLVPKLWEAKKPQSDYYSQRQRQSNISVYEESEHSRRRFSDGSMVLKRLNGSLYQKREGSCMEIPEQTEEKSDETTEIEARIAVPEQRIRGPHEESLEKDFETDENVPSSIKFTG